ncbi:PaaI family thioesterase [Wenyingzhuangia sp. chi5]|uniref:PaaI family thioesterase n=1 Tax=Wenyingzhuangia gilva TaxID=3057677 RepID=A0ABT8VRD8_9FLAO|nr:PaaI family thioesterase [Wenyingzhuangia sp. chi5]MDO3694527.1 PaaI family thioesterase [Wenyingzhuangia sp. chi5]
MDFEKALIKINQVSKNTLMETLGIEYTEIGENYLVATMPVNSRVHQPLGILHGGATVALAESVGSAASFLFVNSNDFVVKGIEISANHLKSKTEGVVTAKATIVHKGRTTHLWQVAITDEDGALISLCKITNIVIPK